MRFLDRLRGGVKERTLAGIKRRAKPGAKITMIAYRLHSSHMELPNRILGVARTVRRVYDDRVEFGTGEDPLYWPHEQQEGFQDQIQGQHGKLAGFVDDDTFIVDDLITYTVYCLAR